MKGILELVLAFFRPAQNLPGAKKIQQAELLDLWTNKNMRRPPPDLLLGNRALHDLRGAKHRFERRRHSSRAQASPKRNVNRDDDVRAIEEKIVGKGIHRSAIDKNAATMFDGTKQAWDRH